MKIISIEVVHHDNDAPYFAQVFGIGINGGKYRLAFLQYGEGVGFILRASSKNREIISQVWPKFVESLVKEKKEE